MLTIHLAWILWVIFGALWTRGRPLAAWFHIASLVWGIIVEVSSLPCPLTLAEAFFDRKAGVDATRGSFLAHYLDALVYPNVPEWLLVGLGVAVCMLNLAIYARRIRARSRLESLP